MPEQRPKPKRRTALVAFPDRYVLPARPAGAAPSVQDAFRQTHFLLTSDLALFERAQNLQLAVVSASAKLRTPEAAALLGLWSRVFSSLSDACALLGQGSYASCPPLLRAAADCIAAQRALIGDEFADYVEWLETGIAQDRKHAARSFDIGRFRGASAFVEDEHLGAIYRLLTDLALPHFGATAIQTAPDSDLKKLALTFSDTVFHLGWAELATGWLLDLASAQLKTASGSGVLTVADGTGREIDVLQRDIAESLAGTRRCRVQEADGRYLFHNFRRAPSGAPKKLIL
jgi:hypothetical protein